MDPYDPILDQPQVIEFDEIPGPARYRLANQDLYFDADANSDLFDLHWPWADSLYARSIRMRIRDPQGEDLMTLVTRYYAGYQETILGNEGMIISKRLAAPLGSHYDRAILWMLECQAEGDRLLRLDIEIDWGEPLTQRIVDGLLVAQSNPRQAQGIYKQRNADKTCVMGNPQSRPSAYEFDEQGRALLTYYVLVNGIVDVPVILTVSDVGEQVAWQLLNEAVNNAVDTIRGLDYTVRDWDRDNYAIAIAYQLATGAGEIAADIAAAMQAASLIPGGLPDDIALALANEVKRTDDAMELTPEAPTVKERKLQVYDAMVTAGLIDEATRVRIEEPRHITTGPDESWSTPDALTAKALQMVAGLDKNLNAIMAKNASRSTPFQTKVLEDILSETEADVAAGTNLYPRARTAQQVRADIEEEERRAAFGSPETMEDALRDALVGAGLPTSDKVYTDPKQKAAYNRVKAQACQALTRRRHAVAVPGLGAGRDHDRHDEHRRRSRRQLRALRRAAGTVRRAVARSRDRPLPDRPGPAEGRTSGVDRRMERAPRHLSLGQQRPALALPGTSDSSSRTRPARTLRRAHRPHGAAPGIAGHGWGRNPFGRRRRGRWQRVRCLAHPPDNGWPCGAPRPDCRPHRVASLGAPVSWFSQAQGASRGSGGE